jgi:hypothetical protein
VVIIARLFGFTGGMEGDLDMKKRIEEDGWTIYTNKQDRHIILMQPARMAVA